MPRDQQEGGHRLGIFDTEDAALRCAREQRPQWDADAWDVVIEGLKDWRPTQDPRHAQ